MKICFLGLDNLPVLVPSLARHTLGGESVQQSLLAKALARRGHQVSMVTADFGQEDGTLYDGVRVWKAYRPQAGLPVVRFLHPRWSGIWKALKRADADVYYTSCAGMQVGLLALFCERYDKPFVFRGASDADFDGTQLLIQYARDRWLYEYGLRRADALLVQSDFQANAARSYYGLPSRLAGMLVEPSQPVAQRDIDLLWVSNIRQIKRPDRALELARTMPHRIIHMIGGPLPGSEAMFDAIRRASCALPNVVFHGGIPYQDASRFYDRARLMVNTSEVEGFPNSYLQSWISGVPVITLFDPDGIVARERLGTVVATPEDLPAAIEHLLGDSAAWQAASERCKTYMERKYGDDTVLADYLRTFNEVVGTAGPKSDRFAQRPARHA